MFRSKAIYLPHLRTIIAETGVGMFSGDWRMQVNNRMVLAGIENLDFHTPFALRQRWTEYQSGFDQSSGVTTTIYHFGFSEDTGVMREQTRGLKQDKEASLAICNELFGHRSWGRTGWQVSVSVPKV